MVQPNSDSRAATTRAGQTSVRWAATIRLAGDCAAAGEGDPESTNLTMRAATVSSDRPPIRFRFIREIKN